MDRAVVRKPEESSISLMAVGYTSLLYEICQYCAAVHLKAGRVAGSWTLSVCNHPWRLSVHTPPTLHTTPPPFQFFGIHFPGEILSKTVGCVPLICFCHCFYRQPRKMQFLEMFRYICGEYFGTFRILFFSARGGIGFPLENITIKRNLETDRCDPSPWSSIRRGVTLASFLHGVCYKPYSLLIFWWLIPGQGANIQRQKACTTIVKRNLENHFKLPAHRTDPPPPGPSFPIYCFLTLQLLCSSSIRATSPFCRFWWYYR